MRLGQHRERAALGRRARGGLRVARASARDGELRRRASRVEHRDAAPCDTSSSAPGTQNVRYRASQFEFHAKVSALKRALMVN